MATMDGGTEPAPQVVFRAGKKRKAYRQRTEESETPISNAQTTTEAAPNPISSAAQDAPSDQDGNEEGLSVAEILRLRNARKLKHNRAAFRAGSSALGDERATSEDNSERGLVLHGGSNAPAEAETSIIAGISKRFAPQTGMVGELVNKHMEEYVESELARRKRHAAEAAAALELQQQQGALGHTPSTHNPPPLGGPTSAVPGPQGDSQRALQGKLLEIDLGEEARARNVEMTERARRRLQGLAAEEEEEGQSEGSGHQPRKVRLGRDGKPLRQRNRRGSDAIKRDQLVEEFLSENKLDVYDLQSEQPANPADFADEDGAADDRIAEEFRRDFMEAMAQRNRRRRPAQSAKPGGAKNTEEILRGPKLGGSRNARAAMRDLLLKEQISKQKR